MVKKLINPSPDLKFQPPLVALSWDAPWFKNYKKLGEQVLLKTQTNTLVDALNASRGRLQLAFVPQADIDGNFTYESFIHKNRNIPTRENAHDFFNGLSWIEFVATKSAMLSVQAKEITKEKTKEVTKKIAENNADLFTSGKTGRGPLRDSMTVFDENGILLCADDQIWEALLAKDWQSLFVKHRHLWSEAKVWLFGHALLEKLLNPRLPITGHVLQLKVPRGLDTLDTLDTLNTVNTVNTVNTDSLDAWLSSQVLGINWREKPFSPLPVLGIPGWWSENSEPGFYENKSVFRD